MAMVWNSIRSNLPVQETWFREASASLILASNLFCCPDPGYADMRRAFFGTKLDSKLRNSARNGGSGLIAQRDRVPLPAKPATAQRANGDLASLDSRRHGPARQKTNASACASQLDNRFGEWDFNDPLRLHSCRLQELVNQRALFARRINQNRLRLQIPRPHLARRRQPVLRGHHQNQFVLEHRGHLQALVLRRTS